MARASKRRAPARALSTISGARGRAQKMALIPSNSSRGRGLRQKARAARAKQGGDLRARISPLAAQPERSSIVTMLLDRPSRETCRSCGSVQLIPAGQKRAKCQNSVCGRFVYRRNAAHGGAGGSERRQADVNSVTSGIGNGADVVQIRAWMLRERPDLGVDALLTRPLEAMLMALAVCQEQDRSSLQANHCARVRDALMGLHNEFPTVFSEIDRVCRLAMNARKRGELRPHAASPAVRAAATKKRNLSETPIRKERSKHAK
jgi:hypothetical protein